MFELRDGFGMTDMLIRNSAIGAKLAAALDDKSVALIRGHGDVVVAPTLPLVVFRAVHTEVNARLQIQATTLGGQINFLTPEEGTKADKVNEQIYARPWELWRKKALQGVAN